MQNYLIRMKYNGTNYSGYQRQKNSNTVGEEVFSCLQKVFGSIVSLSGCSRTDSGVHALDYAISFKSEKVLPEETVIRALNHYLPSDISVFSCIYVPDDFHARYDVTEKEYIYKIYNGKTSDPFYRDFSLFYPQALNLEKMNAAASVLVGTHDFTAFMAAGSKITDCVRTIYTAFFDRDGEIVTFHISGNGFLYKMVRLIVGTMIFVSEDKLSPEEVFSVLSDKKQTPGFAAPPQGLYLNKVTYGRE